MIQELESWLFLVSANRYLDYRTIVAPDFICDRRATSLLARNAGGDLVEHKVVYVSNDKVGELTLVFRVMDAIAEDLNVKGQGVLKDAFGREIYLVEGLVFKGRITEIDLTQEQFREIHDQVKFYYQEFWEWITPQPAFASSGKNVDIHFSTNIQKNLQNQEKYIEVQDITSKKIWTDKSELKLEDEILSLVVLPNSKRVVIRLNDGKQTVSLFSLSGNKDLNYLCNIGNHQGFFISQADNFPIVNIVFKPFSKKIIHSTPIAVNKKGNYIATGVIKGELMPPSDSNFIKIYAVNDSQGNDSVESISEMPGFEVEGGDDTRINTLTFAYKSDKEELIVCGCKDGKVCFYNLQKQKFSSQMEHCAPIRAVTANKENKKAASGDKKGTIIVWDLKGSNEKQFFIESAHKIQNGGVQINSLAFNPNGEILASAGDDHEIKLWEVLTGKEIKSFEYHSVSVNAIAFSPDGKFLASGDDEGYIKIFNIEEEKQTSFIKKHKKPVTSLAFSLDGTILLSGSKDKTVIVWELVKSQ